MTPERDVANEEAFSDESGRPIGEFAPSALTRLADLHAESVETARLANLLGRTPAAALALALGGLLLIALCADAVATPMLAAWAVFVGAGVAALLRIARRTARSAFELLPLRAFVLDLNAVLLYAGFAWGAGAFLVLPAATGTAGLIAYVIGGPALIALILQGRAPTFYFLAPALVLGLGAALTGPAGLAGAGPVLLAGLILGGAAEWAERRTARRLGTAPLPIVTLS